MMTHRQSVLETLALAVIVFSGQGQGCPGKKFLQG
jgi:hypothetical protein